MKYIIIALVLIAAGAAGFSYRYFNVETDLPTVTIGSLKVQVETAETDDEKTLGLSYRDSLDQNAGMLFVYSSEGDYGFWMREMRFPIDIIWMNAQKQVVHIAENVSPDTYPEVFKSASPAQYILEVNTGLSGANSITAGNQAVFDL